MSVAGPTGAPVAEETEGVGALPGSFCSVFYGGESDADALIVSDLPLQGGSRFASEQVSEAIAYVLRRHGFRAGSHRVAYQSCDDSMSQTGIFDEAKCEANAKAYAANADVVGVVGPYNSGCAFAQLPILNRARGGPVATVGFSTSVIDLTRLGPTGPRDGLQRLYPTGTRNYVRVFSADDFHAAAHALLARSLGLQRVFLLHDGDAAFGLPRAISFVTAARRLGLRIGGPRAWDPEERGHRRVVDAVARFRPDGVFLGGGIYSNGGAVIRELRSRVPAVRVLAPEFLPCRTSFARPDRRREERTSA